MKCSPTIRRADWKEWEGRQEVLGKGFPSTGAPCAMSMFYGDQFGPRSCLSNSECVFVHVVVNQRGLF